MFLSSEPVNRSRVVILLAAVLLASGCLRTGQSRTYAALLENGRSPEIREKLRGVVRSNAEIIQGLEQRLSQGWLRFAVIGDSVSRSNGAYRDLLAAVAALDPPPAFVVNLGDFTRGRAEHFSFYFETIKGYPLPIIHVMGNHEAQYPAEMVFRTVFGERDFSFDLGDARFIFMGSEKLGFSPPRLEWLEDRLKDRLPSKKIFVSHEYMFEAYREVLRGITLHFVERIRNTDKVLELLDRYHVPLAIFGHLHRYYEKTYRGTVMVMTGGGGQAALLEPRAKEPLSTKQKHFAVFDLPTGPGEAFRVAVSARDRRGAPLFPTSFYRSGTEGDTGGPRMMPVPYGAAANDPAFPPYLRDQGRPARVGRP